MPTSRCGASVSEAVPEYRRRQCRISLPARFVRKEAKTYGTLQIAEGGDVDDRRVCLIEDVITYGGVVIDATHAVRDAGAFVDAVVCVIDGESGGHEKLTSVGLEMRAVFTKAGLEAAGR